MTVLPRLTYPKRNMFRYCQPPFAFLKVPLVEKNKSTKGSDSSGFFWIVTIVENPRVQKCSRGEKRHLLRAYKMSATVPSVSQSI